MFEDDEDIQILEEEFNDIYCAIQKMLQYQYDEDITQFKEDFNETYTAFTKLISGKDTENDGFLAGFCEEYDLVYPALKKMVMRAQVEIDPDIKVLQEDFNIIYIFIQKRLHGVNDEEVDEFKEEFDEIYKAFEEVMAGKDEYNSDSLKEFSVDYDIIYLAMKKMVTRARKVKIVSVWERSAHGDADAQYNLGWMYQNGNGVPQSDSEAVKWYRKAAEQGHADAKKNLDCMSSTSKSVPLDESATVTFHRKAAEQGDAAAQFWMGWVYANGNGVPQDFAEAIKWYSKAAEQGNAGAQNNLAIIYQNGTGVPKDFDEAVKWYRKAAEQGNADAQNWLGRVYLNGQGVPRDDAEAVKWYRKAAEQGNADAQFQMGFLYHVGNSVPQDYAEAMKWYRKAAEQGHATAQCNLGVIYQNGNGVPQDFAEAVKWYRKAAELGLAAAQNNLGTMYQNGKGVPQDDAKAAKWLFKAAKHGNVNAQNWLGWMYRNGKGVPQNNAEAFQWYRKAAEQGDADAKKNLDQMKAEGIWEKGEETQTDLYCEKCGSPMVIRSGENGRFLACSNYPECKNTTNFTQDEFGVIIEVGKAEGKPPSEQRVEVTTSGSKNKKSSTVDRHLLGATECKALLDACTPLLYLHNAFRITGIPVDASARDIKRRIDDIKAAAEMGDLKDELIHAFALEPTPSFDQIREAAQRLQEPEQRIIDEFFWFWPYESGKSNNDAALRALRNCDYDSACRIWSDAISDNHAPRSTVAKHNLAVMYHLKALDAEQSAPKSDLSNEQLFAISKHWRTCFKWWEELAEDETLWSLVADRIRVVNDPRLTTGFARRLRATLPEAMDKINAMLAIDFAECNKGTQATAHINYMKETHQGKDNIPQTLSLVTKPHKARVTSAVENATSIAKKQPAQAAKAALELLQAISEPLKVIQIILPAEDHERIDLCDTVAEACLTCQIAHARESEDWTTSLEILDSASKYAASKETRERLAENRSIVVTNQSIVSTSKHLDPLLKKIRDIDELNVSIADKMNDIKNDLLPHLANIKKFPGISDDVYEKCADAIAQYIRGLSVSEYNENNNLIGALRILDVSISVARGREVREQLQEDKAKLINIQKETTKHNLQMQIRSDEIEVTNEFVRYNDQNIPVSGIHGVKYGVFIQTINGIRTSSYLIDITGEQSRSIHIECKRFFRNETQAEQDFNRILEALFHQVVPALVQRLAERIVTGIPLQVGGCRLTREGMYIATGSLLWKKETLVPFSDLKFNKYSGQIIVSSVKDKGGNASMAIRDIWNAALLEFITNAVVEIKAKR